MARKKTGVSLQDIADRLSISKNAVSLALNGKPGVGEDLRKKVVDMARELGYAGPSGESREPSHNFLALVPENDTDDGALYNHIFLGLERGLKDAGHHVMIANVGPAMAEAGTLPRIFRSFRFAGLILIGDLPPGYIRSLVCTGLPLVLVDNSTYGLSLCSVGCAQAEAAWQVTSHCLERCSGTPGFIGPVEGSTKLFERWCGYRRALADHGRMADPALEITDNETFSRGALKARIEALSVLPEAFFCATDVLAIQVAGIIAGMGLRIPQDVSLAGCDDIQAAHLVSPALTTYRTPRINMGRHAADLITRLAGGEDPADITQRTDLYGELMVRQSVR